MAETSPTTRSAIEAEGARYLDEIAYNTEQIEQLKAALQSHMDARGDLIRAALDAGLRRADIAAAARVKEARLYQIRDGRR